MEKKKLKVGNYQTNHPKVIPCCTDENLFQSKNISDKREELGIKKDDFILSYVGSIGTWYMLDEMLDFFKVLNEKKPNAKFLFITKMIQIWYFLKQNKKDIKRKN